LELFLIFFKELSSDNSGEGWPGKVGTGAFWFFGPNFLGLPRLVSKGHRGRFGTGEFLPGENFLNFFKGINLGNF